MVAELRVGEAAALRSMANVSTSSSEKEELRQRAWAILVHVHALLFRRLADKTLLPGTIMEEEVMYYARSQAFARKAKNEPVPSEVVLQGLGVVLGYATLLDVVVVTLALLVELRGCALRWESAHAFVLTALDAIPRTATMQSRLTNEADIVAMMETDMKPQNFEPSFCAAVLRKWRSSAVADVLHARGMLQIGVAAYQEGIAAFDARQRADIEKIGLRECAWPSCDKVERTVREFKQVRLSLRVVLQPGASHARLGGAQKGLPQAGQGAAGGSACRRRGIGRCSMNWMHDARCLSILCDKLHAATHR